MSKKISYKVGYAKPPKHSQFSKDYQPTTRPRKLPPPPAVTMIELDKELVSIRQPDGSQVAVPATEARRDKLVDKALHNDLKAARRVYRHLDDEHEAWIENPRYKSDANEQRKLSRELVKVLNQLRIDLNLFMKLGLIEHIIDNEYCIASWVMRASERRPTAGRPEQRPWRTDQR